MPSHLYFIFSISSNQDGAFASRNFYSIVSLILETCRFIILIADSLNNKCLRCEKSCEQLGSETEFVANRAHAASSTRFVFHLVLFFFVCLFHLHFEGSIMCRREGNGWFGPSCGLWYKLQVFLFFIALKGKFLHGGAILSFKPGIYDHTKSMHLMLLSWMTSPKSNLDAWNMWSAFESLVIN